VTFNKWQLDAPKVITDRWRVVTFRTSPVSWGSPVSYWQVDDYDSREEAERAGSSYLLPRFRSLAVFVRRPRVLGISQWAGVRKSSQKETFSWALRRTGAFIGRVLLRF
jgi:hypothetical protein